MRSEDRKGWGRWAWSLLVDFELVTWNRNTIFLIDNYTKKNPNPRKRERERGKESVCSESLSYLAAAKRADRFRTVSDGESSVVPFALALVAGVD